MDIISYDTPLPSKPQPIYIIGAGGIVNDAHLPAYKISGFPVAGIFDLDKEKAEATAKKFSIPHVFNSIDEMLAHAGQDVVFDVALPGSEVYGVLQKLPVRSAVLIQKPMGNNIEEARAILQLTREKKLIAAINFQLRYAPFINAARSIIQKGLIGELCDVEVNINVYTPWNLWSFLNDSPRVEILYHSIHYIDLIRNFLGNPRGIYAKTVKHPNMKELASVRSNIILDYNDFIRTNILTNHVHICGMQHQHSYIKFEGTKGAIKIKLGLLMDYPRGVADSFEYAIVEDGTETEWQTKEIIGGWFPHAFIGSMAQVMLAMEGAIEKPDNSVEDCIHTMACVEAAYVSSERGGEPPNP